MKNKMSVFGWIILTLICHSERLAMADVPTIGTTLSDPEVTAFANLALQSIEREYPNKPSNVMVDEKSVLSPRKLHPAFFGCFDWHSSVHGHWMLTRLLRLHPDCSASHHIRHLLSRQLTEEKMKAEAHYFDDRHNRSFERMYGWAWALRLATELHGWDDAEARQWQRNFEPLEDKIVELTRDYLPRLTYPIRTGVHPNTAFALAQILDYAKTKNDEDLTKLVTQRSRDYFLNDRDYPTAYEPSGEDFFSPCLLVADLMRRVLDQDEFSKWLESYLPRLRHGSAEHLFQPVEVSEVTDGKLVHLAGLNLSRAWALSGVAHALCSEDMRRQALKHTAQVHAGTGLKYVFSGHYEGEHWLATFAVYLLTEVGID